MSGGPPVPAAGRTAIVVGASSGIGRAVAVRLAREGWRLGVASRRLALLESLRDEIGPETLVQPMDVADAPAAAEALRALIGRLGGADLVVLSAGAAHLNPDLDSELERDTLAVNVMGLAALADAAMRHFVERGRGHLVTISSIAALRGSGWAPAYGASKAFVSTYADALRHWAVMRRVPIAVTDVQPGFVDTDLSRESPRRFWLATPERAAADIVRAIRARRKRAVVPLRWVPVAWAMRLVPGWILRPIVSLALRRGGR